MVEIKDIKNRDTAKEKKAGSHKNRVYKTCGCGFVGYGLKQFPSNAKGKCKKCWRALQDAKRKASIQLSTRPCKICGRPLKTSDKRKVVCSVECGYESMRKPKVCVDCCICGKQIKRYQSQVAKRDNFCCSLECQRKHSLVENRGAPEKDWRKHSTEARKKWKKQQSGRRAQANKWWQACVKNNSKFFVSSLLGWQSKCMTASATLNQRAVVRREQEWKLSCLSWNATIKRHRNIAKMRMARIELPNWERKCCSVARNIKHRLSN